MARWPSFCGVVLAAGASTRMGTDKALLPWADGTFLSGQVRALQPFTDLVIVVAGANAAALTPVVYAEAGFVAVNPQPELGQFSSLQIGLREVLNRGRDAAIIALVDRPPASRMTVAQLKARFLDAYERGKWAVVPEFEGKHGHPIVVGRELIEAFLKAPATATARDVEHEHQSRVEYVAVEDRLVVQNIDTPADYQAIRQAE